MVGYRTDRVVRLLTALVSFAYFALLTLAVVVLMATPALKVFAPEDPDWTWGLPVPVAVSGAETRVATQWGDAALEVEDVRGSLRLPIGMLPWWLFAILWMHLATAAALMLLFLHHLRRLFQRVRDGASFDATNAARLRWLGLLLVAGAVLNGVAEVATSLAVRSGLESGGVTVPATLGVDGSLVFFGLVLLALAEVFRRGAELEDEQSLVV